MRNLPTGTVTFLFTDIEGSTRLLQELGADAYAQALGEHRRVLRELFDGHGGVEVDAQGDAFFYAFARASDALAAAEDAQRRLADGPVRVRVGVHTGEPTLTDEGYVGVDVHRAARIMGAGHGGQVLVSEQTARLAGVDGLVDLGAHRLKDLSASERVYQSGEGVFPRLKTLYQTNLPVPPTALVGRKKELADLRRLLTSDDLRVVTLTGPGGIGKTRLGLAAAGESADAFPDGVWFVDLAPLGDAELVRPAIADAVGAEGDLEAHLVVAESLLVLDNFEHLTAAALAVGALLAACPHVRALVTSREPLRIAIEREYALRPLPESPAVELFRQRVAAVAPDVEVEYALADEICARVDRLPLAIELAAARARALGSTQLLERLDRRLPVLTTRRRDAPERQRTLRATIEWSYELLGPDEQKLFAALGVFAGGWSLEAAEAVCGADLDTLESLVEKSLVRRDGSRFSMLETIREFAAELLEEEGRRDAVAAWHAAYFLEFAEGANQELMYGGGFVESWAALAAEEQNLRAAMEWARAEGAVEFQLQLAHAIRSRWSAAGRGVECRAWIEEALRRGGDALPPLVRARALANAGWLARRQRDAPTARAYHEQSLELYRAAGDREGVARSLVGLGGAAVLEDRLEDARPLFEEAAATARAAGSRPVAAGALDGLITVAIRRGDVDALRELVDEAAADADDEYVWELRGHLALVSGDAESAVEKFAAALRESHDLGFRIALPRGLASLAEALAARGDSRAAAVVVASAEAAERALGVGVDPWEEARRRELVADLARRLGDHEYVAARAEGLQLSPEDAVAYALAAVD